LIQGSEVVGELGVGLAGLRVALDGVLAPGVSFALPVLDLELATRNAAFGFHRKVDAGGLSQTQLTGRIGYRVGAVTPRVVSPGLLPHAIGQSVEHGVAGDFQSAGQGDIAVRGGFVVTEHLRSELHATRTVVRAVQVESLFACRQGADHFVGRTGRENALRRVGREGAGVHELFELFLRHASDPDRRVVGGVAGHRQNASGLDIDDNGRSRVPGVALPLRTLHRPHELVFHDRLQMGIQARDQVLARFGIELLEGASDSTGSVHRKRGDAGLSPHFLVVVRLQTRATDNVGASQPVGCGRRPLFVELLLGHRTEVTQQMRGVDVEGGGVFANRIESRINAPIHLPLFHDGESRLRINVLSDRHRLVRGAVPAHRRWLRVLGSARLQAVGDSLGGQVQDSSQSLDHGLAAVGLAAELDLVHGDHQ